MAQEPDGTLAADTSVEFCGGTHLANGGHIGRFVLVSEEAIAKGIRRVVAVTGVEGERAEARLAALTEKVAVLEADVAAEKESRAAAKGLLRRIQELTEDVNAAVMSYAGKDELRSRLKAAKKVLDDVDKAAKAALGAAITEEAKAMDAESAGKVVVHRFADGAAAKALDGAAKALKSAAAALLFSADPEAGKVTCVASVSKAAQEKGLKAGAWVGAVAGELGGKGGGKDASAQAVGTKPDALPKAIDLAKTFAAQHIS